MRCWSRAFSVGDGAALAEVAHEAGEQRRLALAKPRDGELDRELRPVAAQRGELEPPVEDRGVSRLEVALERVAVGGAQRPRDDQVGQLRADRLLARMAEDLRSGRVPVAHEPVGAHDDHGVAGGEEDAMGRKAGVDGAVANPRGLYWRTARGRPDALAALAPALPPPKAG